MTINTKDIFDLVFCTKYQNILKINPLQKKSPQGEMRVKFV